MLEQKINIFPTLLEEPETRHEADNAYLAYAVRNNLEDVVRVFLGYGADPNCYNGLPLRVAQEKGYRGLVELLKRYGAK
jgi:ankyrin repeat protein